VREIVDLDLAAVRGSACSARGTIIPGPGDAPLFEYERFASRIHFYPPGDEGRLRATFEGLAGKKLVAKRGDSNVTGYIADFDRFVRALTTDRSA